MIIAFRAKLALLSPSKKSRIPSADPTSGHSDTSSQPSSLAGASISDVSTQSSTSNDANPYNDARDRWQVGVERPKTFKKMPPVTFDPNRPGIFSWVDKIAFPPTPQAQKLNLWVSLLVDDDNRGWLVSNRVQQGSWGKFHLAIDVETEASLGAKQAHCSPLLGYHTIHVSTEQQVKEEASRLREFSPKTPLYGIFENRLKPKVYTLMGRMDGDLFDLADAVAKGTREDRQAVGRSVFKDLSHALKNLHGKGYVHGDVKLENSLFSVSGGSILTDFGTLEAMDQHGNVPGNAWTTTYPAPEELQGPVSSPAKDMWALGVLLLAIYAANDGVEMFSNAKGPEGLKTDLDAFAVWRQAVLTQDPSTLTPSLREATHLMAKDFATFRSIDNRTANFALVNLMNPDPRQRATAADAAQFIDDLMLKTSCTRPRVERIMARVAQQSDHLARFAEMRTYLPAARDVLRARSPGGFTLDDLSFAA